MGAGLSVDFAFVYALSLYVASFFVYSLAGWLFEVVISLFQHHRFVNRGFSFGPVCPIYGVGALLAILFLSRLPGPLAQFVVGFFAAGILEFGTSWAMERIFHARWWDYSNIPLNLNGRVCVPGLMLFSLLMLGVNFVAQPALEAAFALVPPQALVLATMAACLVFAVDLTASVIRMQGFAEKLRGVQGALSGLPARAREAMRAMMPDVAGLRDDVFSGIRQLVEPGVLDEVSDRLKELARGAQSSYERKSMADPRFKFTQYGEAFDWLRNVAPRLRKASADMAESLSEAAGKVVQRRGSQSGTRDGREAEDAGEGCADHGPQGCTQAPGNGPAGADKPDGGVVH